MDVIPLNYQILNGKQAVAIASISYCTALSGLVLETVARIIRWNHFPGLQSPAAERKGEGQGTILRKCCYAVSSHSLPQTQTQTYTRVFRNSRF